MTFRNFGILFLIVTVCCLVTACGGGGGSSITAGGNAAGIGTPGSVSGKVSGDGDLSAIPVYLFAESQAPSLPGLGGTTPADIPGQFYSTLTDADGNFVFPEVVEGNYNAIAQADRFRSAIHRKLGVIRANTITVNLTLTATGEISGKVLAPQGANLLGILAFIPGTSFGAFADATGSYRIIGVPVGSYSLTFSGSGFLFHVGDPIVVTAGKIASVPDVTLAFGSSFMVSISGQNLLKGNGAGVFQSKIVGSGVGPYTYAWTATTGAFLNSTAADANWTAPADLNGTVELVCKVTDFAGASATGKILVEVSNLPNVPPQASLLGPSVVLIGSAARFITAAYDPEGALLSFQWIATGGTFLAPAANQTDWTPPTATGNHLIQCHVTDAQGAMTIVSLEVAVKSPILFNYWQKCVGGSGEDTAYACSAMTPSGFYVVGDSSSLSVLGSANHGDIDVMLVKMSPSGNVDWAKLFGGTGADHGMSVKMTPDGGCIVAGYTNSSGTGDVGTGSGAIDTWILKVDSAGNKEWNLVFGYNSTSNDYGMDVSIAANGNYYVAGGYSGGTSYTSMRVSEISPAGKILNTFTNTNAIQGEIGRAVTTLTGGGLIVGQGTSNSYYRIFKLSSSGGLIWWKGAAPVILGTTEDRYSPNSIEQTSDTGCIIAGFGSTSSEENGFLQKFDSNGTSEWTKSFGTQSYNDQLRSALPTPEGEILVAGYGNMPASGTAGVDGYVARYTNSGTLLWERFEGSTFTDRVMGMALAENQGFVLVGDSNSSTGLATGNNGGTDFWITRWGY